METREIVVDCASRGGRSQQCRQREKEESELKLTECPAIDARSLLPIRLLLDHIIVCLFDVKVAAILALCRRKLSDSVDVLGVRSSRSQSFVSGIRRDDSGDLDRQVGGRDVATESTSEKSTFDCE